VKKSTLIRSDKPHAVNMPAGSNVAARQSTQKFKSSETSDDSPTNIQKVVPVKTPKSKRIEPPTPAVKTVRAKALEGPLFEAPTPLAKPKSKPPSGKTARSKPKLRSASPSSSAKAQALDAAPTPIEPIWEQDNPVKTRIDQLRARNAQLAEQLQRLPQMPTARGKRP
jgi:hypothetical protein